MPMNNEALDAHIRRRPSVHQLCLGTYLQHAMFVSDDVLAVPLSAVGFNDVAQLVGDYVSADLAEAIQVKHVNELRENGKRAFPAVGLVWHPAQDASTKVLVDSATASFTRARRVLSWVSGEEVVPVAYAILHAAGVAFQVMPPSSRRRQRLWFGEREASEFELATVGLAMAANQDPNLGLALEFFHDAMREGNDLFRIVRLYNVLECLAAKHKAEGVGSRDAVREMLAIGPGQSCTIHHKGTDVNFDLISVAGRIRDRTFHGARITADAFAVPDRGVMSLLQEVPLFVANELQWRIELEISRRAAAGQVVAAAVPPPATPA